MSTNYVQKATGTSPSGLTDSIVFDDGSKVGVGTTSPSSTVHVNGGTGSLATGLVFGDGDTGFYEPTDDDLVVATRSSEHMRFVVEGRLVFIGQPSVNAKLSIFNSNTAANYPALYVDNAEPGGPAAVFTSSSGGNGNVGIGVTTPTASVHLKAGTTGSNTAPLKFNSGSLMTTAETGAMEFNSDDLLFTITTGSARKGIFLDDGARLTSGKYPKASTNGRLVDGPTPLAGTKTYYVADSSGGALTRKLTFTDGILTSET